MKAQEFQKYLIGAVLILLAIVGLLIAKVSKKNDTIDQVRSILTEQQDTVSMYKNKYGEAVAQKAAAEADRKLLLETYGKQFEDIKKHMDLNSKQVRGIFSVVTEIAGEGTGTVDTVDVIDGTDTLSTIHVSDFKEWFWISGAVWPDGKFKYLYGVKDSITLVPYRVGRDLYVKGLSANPNVRITGLQGILVATDPKSKPWGIGPSIQIGYDTQVRITPGISVQYSLIRF